MSVIKQFQFSFGRKMESNIVWQKVLRTTALTLNNYTCLTRKENGENTLCPAPNADKDRKQLKQRRTKTWSPAAKASRWQWRCMHRHTHTGMRTHTPRWEIKCRTGDREQNRHFLSPFSFEFTWREEVREVKQILPSLCEVPLRGLGGACRGYYANLSLTAAYSINVFPVTDRGPGSTHGQQRCGLYIGNAGKLVMLISPHRSRASSLECRALWRLGGWLF